MEQQEHHSTKVTTNPSVKRKKGCGCGSARKAGKTSIEIQSSKPVVKQKEAPRRRFVPSSNLPKYNISKKSPKDYS